MAKAKRVEFKEVKPDKEIVKTLGESPKPKREHNVSLYIIILVIVLAILFNLENIIDWIEGLL